MAQQRFTEPVSAMSQDDFVQRFGRVYEYSPWVASRTWEAGLSPIHDTVQGLANAMADILARASHAQKLALVRAHPDLIGQAAIALEPKLTPTNESLNEQASTGLDQCSAAEFRRFENLNDRYWLKFDFPFVMAVCGQKRDCILKAFERRLDSAREVELQRALVEIDLIARRRMESIID